MGLKIIDLGLVDFNEAWAKQRELFKDVLAGSPDNALLICRHLPVITLGRSAKKINILVSLEKLRSKGIAVYEVSRGGDVTYHGPGQLTVYPILNLNLFRKDIHWFLRLLEGWIISYLTEFGITGERINGLTGVWVGKSKLASIGISVKNWITLHGFSINIKNDDLKNFSLIKPCGMDIMMTSVESESAKTISMELAKARLISSLGVRLPLYF